MKKLFTVIIFVFCIFMLCGCSNSSENKTTLADLSETSATGLSTVTVTIPEGFTAVQIAERLEENEVCSAEAFMTEINDIEKLKGIYRFIDEISTESKAFYLEGYIFPDTYEFYKNEGAAAALSRFLKNTESKLTDEYYTRADELGFTMDEIITLASIVQSESGYPDENKLVSSVLHNRIKSPYYGRLQCDVTIAYINTYISDSLYLDGDTERFKELYNTYKCKGLPAGAICNPGRDCIVAALYPEETDYYFFVTDKDMNYYYNKTFDAHLAKCRELGLM